MDRSLCMDLIHRTRILLDSIRSGVMDSRDKFADRDYGAGFCKTVTDDVEKIDLLLNGFLNYIKSTTPVIKKGTVNALIEETVKRHQALFEERKIRVFKKFERELPETIVPDEQMIFILDSVLQYAAATLSSGSGIEILTRSFDHLAEGVEAQPSLREKSKHLEVAFAFMDYQKRSEERVKAYGLSLPQREGLVDLLLRLVLAIVERNSGTMEFESDQAKAKRSLVLRLPVERRTAIHYELIDEQFSPFDRNLLRQRV